MPPADSVVHITTRILDIGLIFLFIVGLLIIIFGVILWQSRKIKRLNSTSLELSERIAEIEPEGSESTAAREAYLQFIYNLSHEIANPLQSIQINLENLASSSPDDSGHWKQTYAMISVELKRLFKLTDSLRLLSRLENADNAIRREPVNLKSVIEDIIMAEADRAEMKDIHLAYRGPDRPARVLGDRDQLYQAISNLVENSIKYSKDSGEIVISLQDEGGSILVRVSDEGIGISEEDLPFIFDTAYRSPTVKSVKRAGSGLGLAITKQIVEQHGGDIEVHSKDGEGTTISFKLPLYDPKVQ